MTQIKTLKLLQFDCTYLIFDDWCLINTSVNAPSLPLNIQAKQFFFEVQKQKPF